MRTGKISRRKFLAGAALAMPIVALGDAGLVEPNWLRVRTMAFHGGKPRHRLVHFTDLHYKGNRAFLNRVVRTINSLAGDFVLFTGDVIEEPEYLAEAVQGLGKIKSPLVGVPGNHDYWAKINFDSLDRCFAASGGAWLLDQQWRSPDGQWTVTGETCLGAPQNGLVPDAKTRNVLLVHYPAWAKKLGGRKFDLILAGHSHGGQVRLPFIGPIVTPFGVDEYELGFYASPGGPLYVNPGIGWFYMPFRFRCRPEITVLEF